MPNSVRAVQSHPVWILTLRFSNTFTAWQFPILCFDLC